MNIHLRLIYLSLILVTAFSHSTFAEISNCDYKIELLINSSDEFKMEDFKWRMRAIRIEGGSTNMTGTAELKDSNGKVIKNYKPWTLVSISNQRTSNEYSPNLQEGFYDIIAQINVECNDVNKSNNIDIRRIKINYQKQEWNNSKITNQKNDFVQQPVNTSSKNLEIVNASNKTEINLPTCNVLNQSVPIKVSNPSSNNNNDSIVYDNIIYLKKSNTTKNSERVYISKDIKASQLILIFLLAISIIINIVLIWKR